MTKGAAWKVLDRSEEVCAAALLVAVMAITVYNVVNRYLLKQSAVWAPELAGFLFTWVVFLGASAATRRGMHVSIGVFVDRLGPRTRRWTILAGDVILIAFFAYASWLALKITISSYSRVSPAMHLPYTYVYASVVVCFAVSLVRSLAAFRQGWAGSPEGGGE